jgi:hypothetical protein
MPSSTGFLGSSSAAGGRHGINKMVHGPHAGKRGTLAAAWAGTYDRVDLFAESC